MSKFETARQLIYEFKADHYHHGLDVLPCVGEAASGLGRRVALVRDKFPGSDRFLEIVHRSLSTAGIELLGELAGAAPNAPREDVARITAEIGSLQPESVISFGGGSTIDAAKAAILLASLGGSIDDYFGTGLVAQAMESSG